MVFLPSQKPTSQNSISTRIEHAHENELDVFQAGRVSQKSVCKANLVKCHSTEITGPTAGTSDTNYIDKEAQLLGNMDDRCVGVSLHGQAPDKSTEAEEDEPIASLSRSSSSEGIWPSPDAVQRGYQQRTSTIGMSFFINILVNVTSSLYRMP